MACVQFSIRTSSVLICCTYLVFHAAFLVINFIILSNTESHLTQLSSVTTNTKILDLNLQPASLNAEDAEKYLLLPIMLNIFMIISNLLAAWGALILNHLLILPWLALYFTYILFAFGLLLYMVIVLYHVWFKIVIFLIVSPILILAIIFWLTLLELYFLIKIHNSRKSKLTKHSSPSCLPRPYPLVHSTLPPVTARPTKVPPLPADNVPPRETKVGKKPSFLRGVRVHRPVFRRSDNKTNLKHRSYRHLARGSQGRRQAGDRRNREEGRRGKPKELVQTDTPGGDEEDDHYQRPESHYQTPKMSRCQPGAYGSSYCISMVSAEKNMMRGEEEMTVDWRQENPALP